MSSAHDEWRLFKAAFSRAAKPDSDSGDSEGDLRTVAPLSPDEYRYSSFTGEDCIRLLELQPGQHLDPITCQLQEVRLDDCTGRYAALSYVWGPPEGAMRIRVNDGSLVIRSNLHCALRNLRHADRPRTLWVDAVCINQSDISERNAQVPMMGEVYRNAACTICFLGPKRKTTRALYAMLEDLAQEARTLHAEGSIYHDMDTLPAFVRHVTINPVKSELFHKYAGDFSIMDMAACEWWHRAWTVQEILLSPNVLFMNGRYTVKWDTVCLAVDHGINLQIWLPISFGFIMDLSIVPYLSMRALMNRRSHSFSAPTVPPSGSSARDLLHFLTHCRHRRSADPRDKVYAVLGLLRDAHSNAMASGTSEGLDVKLDYNHPVVYVYRKTAQTLISKLDSLEILGTVPKSTRRALPSWVTDWSISLPIGSPLTKDSLDRDRPTHASKHTNANAQFPDDGVTMILRGHELTSILELAGTLSGVDFEDDDGDDVPVETGSHNHPEQAGDGQPNSSRHWKPKLLKMVGNVMKNTFQQGRVITGPSTSMFGTLFAWDRFSATQPATNPSSSSSPPSSSDLDSAFWQTLCAGTYKNNDVEKTRALYKSWSDSLQPVREFMEKHASTHDRLPEIAFAKFLANSWESYSEFWPYIACAQHRRLGRAANGWLCLLPEETQVGDCVVLVCGGRVPLVVRPDGDGYNMFVGEAYIHGIMDGEAFNAEACSDIRIC